jgi:hypothetical protein
MGEITPVKSGRRHGDDVLRVGDVPWSMRHAYATFYARLLASDPSVGRDGSPSRPPRGKLQRDIRTPRSGVPTDLCGRLGEASLPN